MKNTKKKGLPKATYRYKKNNKTYNIRIDRIVAALVIIIVLIVLLCSCIKACGSSKKTSSNDTSQSDLNDVSTATEDASSTEDASASVATKTVSETSDDIYCGDLILIDGSHPYQFEESDLELSAIADLKNDAYTTSDLVVSLDTNVISHLNDMMEAFYTDTGLSDIRIIAGYRTYDEQQEKYSSGSASTMAGYSEYHTGRTFSMGIFSSDGTSDYYKPDGDYSWIQEHASEYGFIQRYPEGKEDYTGESEITHIYRYVGVPHSVYMYQNNMCLEEYEAFIKGYSYESPLLVQVSGVSYRIYYVAANEAGATSVEVPDLGEYTISGNNSDGFIVTVQE